MPVKPQVARLGMSSMERLVPSRTVEGPSSPQLALKKQHSRTDIVLFNVREEVHGTVLLVTKSVQQVKTGTELNA